MAKEFVDKELEEEKNINTVLSDDIEFSGTLKFKTSLKIKGKFEGKIDATGHLFIGKKAVVKADVKARKVSIYGKITGNIETTESIELFSGAELTGDIKTPDLIIESGSYFNGNCTMVKNNTPIPNVEKKDIQDKKK